MVKVGQIFSTVQTLSQADFDQFARLSGDDNPIHVDPDFARRTRFGDTVAHGMHLYGLICALLGRHFPGAVQIEQGLMFPAPTYSGEEITIEAKVIETNGRQINVATTIRNSNGQLTCDGQAVLHWESP